MNHWTREYKAFLAGMVFGALLMLILLFPTKAQAFDENGAAVCMAKNIYLVIHY